jgi:hypothetical protein
MKKRDSVLCVACSRPFDVGLLELVRWAGPLWCQPCIAYADQALQEAAQRAARSDPVPEGQWSGAKPTTRG